jgi:hypothetical protein
MIIVQDDEVDGIKRIVTHLRGLYPEEGIACFMSDVEEL